MVGRKIGFADNKFPPFPFFSSPPFGLWTPNGVEKSWMQLVFVSICATLNFKVKKKKKVIHLIRACFHSRDGLRAETFNCAVEHWKQVSFAKSEHQQRRLDRHLGTLWGPCGTWWICDGRVYRQLTIPHDDWCQRAVPQGRAKKRRRKKAAAKFAPDGTLDERSLTGGWAGISSSTNAYGSDIAVPAVNLNLSRRPSQFPRLPWFGCQPSA